MKNNLSDNPVNTYQFCTVQLNVFSLMMVTSLSGFCGGISWAFLLVVAKWLGVATLEEFASPLEVFIGFPVLGALGAGLFAVVGYPIYSWVCKNLRGQRLRGTFYDPRN